MIDRRVSEAFVTAFVGSRFRNSLDCHVRLVRQACRQIARAQCGVALVAVIADYLERLLDFAAAGETHDERLWMPIAEATGAMGNTSCLVGTPEQVARALLEYYKLGIHSFLIRGFDPFEDTIDFGRELIPRLRSGAAELDRAKAA